MTDWDEIRTALHVARLGTVSAAAEALGVHHATVIRHVDALESRLGARLFQRHAKGYTATEAGADLLRVAQEADDRFAQLAGRIRGQAGGDSLAGDLVVTSVAPMARLLTPLLAEFQERHPEVTLRYLTSGRLFRLEAGEAHVALRAGPLPEQPDNVVQPFITMRCALVASPEYLRAHGTPGTVADLARHRFVGHDEPARAPFNRWLTDLVPGARIAFRLAEDMGLGEAVAAGAGLGFLSRAERAEWPALREVLPEREEWCSPLWLVTHVDLHRTPKVQALLAHLKERASGWG